MPRRTGWPRPSDRSAWKFWTPHSAPRISVPRVKASSLRRKKDPRPFVLPVNPRARACEGAGEPERRRIRQRRLSDLGRDISSATKPGADKTVPGDASIGEDPHGSDGGTP